MVFFSYEALKRCLKNGEVKIEDPMEMFGMITTRSLQPQPILLNIKIILVGDPYIYQLLYSYDEDFINFARSRRSSTGGCARPKTTLRQFSSFRRLLPDKAPHAPPQDRHGPPGEYAQEQAGHQQKLTLQLKEVQDVVKEANYWARNNTHEAILGSDVDQAIAEKTYRADHAGKKLQEFIGRRDALHRDQGPGGGADEWPVGICSGGPLLRPPVPGITASVGLGRDGVMTIDRESQLSGNIHNKGVLILAGYLTNPLCQDSP